MAIAFDCVTRSRLPAAELFDRARDIDLHTASQASSAERASGGTVSGLIGPGEHVTWRAWHLGVPLTLTSRVTAFDPPRRFVDEQIEGPFRFFRHEHLFEAVSEGSIMIDRIDCAAPFGILGRAAEELVLARYLRRLIRRRGRFLAER